jgi:hypothetical protein
MGQVSGEPDYVRLLRDGARLQSVGGHRESCAVAVDARQPIALHETATVEDVAQLHPQCGIGKGVFRCARSGWFVLAHTRITSGAGRGRAGEPVREQAAKVNTNAARGREVYSSGSHTA